jgi:hypothetical protein
MLWRHGERNGGVTVLFLTLTMDGGQWVSFTSMPLWVWWKCHRWPGGLVDPRVSLDSVEKRKGLHYMESNPGRSGRSPSQCRLNYLDTYKDILIVFPCICAYMSVLCISFVFISLDNLKSVTRVHYGTITRESYSQYDDMNTYISVLCHFGFA